MEQELNNHLRVGFFPAFKGGDTVLLSGTPTDIADLRSRITQFAGSSAETLDLGTVAAVSAKHPATLWLAKSAAAAQKVTGFALVCSEDNCSGILGMLAPLESAVAGHQYFGLVGGKAQLMVSVGEYDEQWWGREA